LNKKDAERVASNIDSELWGLYDFNIKEIRIRFYEENFIYVFELQNGQEIRVMTKR
jgi:hypothetical protein